MDQREGRLRINLAASMAGSVDVQKQCSKTVRTLPSELLLHDQQARKDSSKA
jgi:hypothetical protein